MKQILIINGSGGVGKDTFVSILSNYIPLYHDSIVNPVKRIARQLGWNGKKNDKSRKFLSDLKKAIDEYNDDLYTQMAELMDDFLSGDKKLKQFELLCIDMREPEQILRAKKEYAAKTILVKRKQVDQIKTNLADAGVYEMKYDYIIDNSSTLFDLNFAAGAFLQKLRGDVA